MEIEKTALQISEWTKHSKMIPKEQSEIAELIMQDKAVFLYDEANNVVGFAAVTQEWEGNWVEIGAVFIDPDKREKGLGHQLVAKLFEKAKQDYPTSNIFALCNDKSLKIFLDNGAEEMKDPNLLPEAVWGWCLKCPAFNEARSQGKICCDTPVQIK